MLRLYVTRHGETVWNTQRRLQGWKDSPLTEKGIHHAKLLGNRLQDVEFQAVYSSPSNRTVTTTECILENRTQSIMTDDSLREIHMGHWEGQTEDELDEHDVAMYQSFFYAPHRFEATTGESFTDVENRVVQILNRITSENDEGNILVVTHTVIIKILLKYVKNIPLENLWEPPYIHDTSLTVLEIDNGQMNFVMEGDISHREQ
ncbi:histidine phosphatase family protein [Bacillus massiliigorillae]|uniref:histidine phosphatase family protein n=1 Tax=Bacillus massiliigorillae TaxID=1243664 RepID=UPI0005A6C3DF|nr:histidine phosphatase family protein [Bacillus massiliigorillae]